MRAAPHQAALDSQTRVTVDCIMVAATERQPVVDVEARSTASERPDVMHIEPAATVELGPELDGPTGEVVAQQHPSLKVGIEGALFHPFGRFRPYG